MHKSTFINHVADLGRWSWGETLVAHCRTSLANNEPGYLKVEQANPLAAGSADAN